MTITTVGTARHITPTVIRTFFKHFYDQARKDREDRHLEATDELLFHEAFAIVKRFISLATNDTVEAIQAFTNTRIPTPPRATVVPVLIPMSSCDRAAKAIIDYFGPEDIKNVVGGEKWWQVRGLNGVEAQWVAMTSDWKKARIVEEMPDGEARVRAAKYAKFNGRHERQHSQRSKQRRKHRSKSRSKRERPAASHTEHQTTAGSMTGDEDSGSGDDTVPVEELDRLRRVLLYVHGGGYYFGSFTTHAYQIIRLARKMGGRAFAPIYRKAPGYPWPAPLQDCLAAYFYLTDPPPGAPHKAIDPNNIVLAGDSAGGGMCLAILAVLRDLGLPMPSGAVLISPWCDMTHSFPSILQNTDTDIIPPYGFVHKPSTLWPIPATVDTSESPSRKVPSGVAADSEPHPHHGSMPAAESSTAPSRSSTPSSEHPTLPRSQRTQRNDIPIAPQPLPSETFNVAMSSGENIELKQQIQLYATNSQLYHPLCSPVLQGSLGGLPPLYIIAGDSEVLRDEVIMLAHRAARPEKYQLPEHLLAKNERAREAAQRFNSQPTKVHLQVFDYQCHVLTLFSFTTAARYAYRAIASFCKYVTNAETTVVDNPFPELREEPSQSSSVFSGRPEDSLRQSYVQKGQDDRQKQSLPTLAPIQTQFESSGQARRDVVSTPEQVTPADDLRQANGIGIADSGAVAEEASLRPLTTIDGSETEALGQHPRERSATVTSSSPAQAIDSLQALASQRRRDGSVSTVATSDGKASSKSESKEKYIASMQEKRRKVTLGVANDYNGQVPLKRPEYREHMIRERVDVRGAVRPLEAEEELQAVRLFVDHPDKIGRIREGPVKRYLEGQHLWDARFKRTAKKVEKRRRANEAKCEQMLRTALKKGLIKPDGSGDSTQARPREWVVERAEDETEAEWVDEARFGPVDVALAKENPPPSALAGRRDCDDAVTLLRTSLHLSARQAGIKSGRAFVREDIFGDAPRLPAAEAQHRPKGKHTGMHGLSIWNRWMGRFTKREARKEGAKGVSKAGQPAA